MRELVGKYKVDWPFIDARRRARGWSQSQLANILGVERSRITKLKSGEFRQVYGPVFGRLLTAIPEYLTGCGLPFRDDVRRYFDAHPIRFRVTAAPRLVELMRLKLHEDLQRFWLTLFSQKSGSRGAAVRWTARHLAAAQTNLCRQFADAGVAGAIGFDRRIDPKSVIQRIADWEDSRAEGAACRSLQRLGVIRVSLPAGQVGGMAALKRMTASLGSYGVQIECVTSYSTSIDQVLDLGRDAPHFSISGMAPFALNRGASRSVGEYRFVCPLTWGRQWCCTLRRSGDGSLRTVHVCSGASGELDHRIHRESRYRHCDRRELRNADVRQVLAGLSPREGIILWEPMAPTLAAEGLVRPFYRQTFPVWMGLFCRHDLFEQPVRYDFTDLFLRAYAQCRRELVTAEESLLDDERFTRNFAVSAGIR